jgi:ArsR family transcriptional regulator, lead/cadmium/zinc/bismuth-responsive transcriptional repressor
MRARGRCCSLMSDSEVEALCDLEHAPRLVKRTITDATFERAAAIFRAAGDVSRLKLLEFLSAGECCVSELAEATHTGMSTVSQQLKVLRAERLILRKRVGKHIYYSLADDHIVELLRGALAHADEPHVHGDTSES